MEGIFEYNRYLEAIKNTRKAVEQVIDQRLKEFTPENKFKNSKQLGK